MTFLIEFIDDKRVSDLEVPEGFWPGRIVIDEFEEHFEASLSFWSINDYRSSWKTSLERILSGKGKSCLITSMYDPLEANFIIWWPLYRENEIVFIQNQMLIFDDLYDEFDSKNPYVHIPDRRTINQDGDVISEWSTNVNDFRDFLGKLQTVSNQI